MGRHDVLSHPPCRRKSDLVIWRYSVLDTQHRGRSITNKKKEEYGMSATALNVCVAKWFAQRHAKFILVSLLIGFLCLLFISTEGTASAQPRGYSSWEEYLNGPDPHPAHQCGQGFWYAGENPLTRNSVAERPVCQWRLFFPKASGIHQPY